MSSTVDVVRERPQLALGVLLVQTLGIPAPVAEALANAAGQNARALVGMTDEQLQRVPGVGPAIAGRVLAMGLIAQRYATEQRGVRVAIRGPKDAATHCAAMADLPVEEFHVLALDAQHRIKRDILVTRGTLNASLVHPREVFAGLIAERAAAVVLVHNHPSGDPTPSDEDRAVTEQMVAAGRLLDIPVHDHIIIGNGRYVSFAEAGLM